MTTAAKRGTKSPGKSADRNPSVRPDETPGLPPEEAGGEDSTSLFNAKGDSRVRVFRRDDKTMKYVFHGYLGPDASEATVAEAFGGGAFRTQMIVVNDEGKEIIKAQHDIILPGSYKPPMGILPGVKTEPTPGRGAATMAGVASVTPAADNSVAALNAAVIGSVVDLLKTMRQVQAPAKAEGSDMLVELMRNQANMQTKILELLMTRDRGDSKKDILEMMETMKGIVTPTVPPNPNNPKEMMENIVGMIKSVREASDEIGDNKKGGGDFDPMMQMLPKLAEVVAEEHEARRARAAAQQPRPMVPALRPAIATPNVQDAEAAMHVPSWKRMLQQFGPQLIASAQAGRNPETVARVAVEFAPSGMAGTINEFFNHDENEVIATLQRELPPLEEFHMWVTAFVQSAQVILFGEVEEAATDDSVEEGPLAK